MGGCPSNCWDLRGWPKKLVGGGISMWWEVDSQQWWEVGMAGGVISKKVVGGIGGRRNLKKMVGDGNAGRRNFKTWWEV